MMRTNDKTNSPFKHGYIREDGFIFGGYQKKQPKTKNGFFKERWYSPEVFEKLAEKSKHRQRKERSQKDGHLKRIFLNIKSRSAREGVLFNLSLEYVKSISVDFCPILGVPIAWGGYLKGQRTNAPSLDRIIPELGYVEGNVQWLSFRANRMKSDASFSELHQFADWIKKTIPDPS